MKQLGTLSKSLNIVLAMIASIQAQVNTDVTVQPSPPQIVAQTTTGTSSDSVMKFAEIPQMRQLFGDSVQTVELTLEQIIGLAVENNRDLRRYQLLGESAKIQLEQAEYRYLPSAYISGSRREATNVSLGEVEKTIRLSSNLGFSRNLETGGQVSLGLNTNNSESSAKAGIVNYNSGISISVSQPLLRGRGIAVNQVPIENAKNYANISLLNVSQNLINIVTNIESRYWDLILVYQDFEIQQQALRRAQALLEINKSLIEAGRMASQEIVQTESDIASREISVAGAENEIISTQIALQSHLDLPQRIIIHPSTQMQFKPVEISLENCLLRAFKFRPDWLISQRYLDIERMNLMVARNNTLYTLGSFASMGSDVTSDQSLQRSLRDAISFKELSWNVGLSFIFPFNKQVLQNEYELYRLSFERQQIYVEELSDDIRIAVENAVRSVQYSLKRVQLALRAKELAKAKLTLEEDKMKVGRSTNFQVISYQRDLTNAQNEELRAIASYLKALGQLEATMGTTLQRWNIQIEQLE